MAEDTVPPETKGEVATAVRRALAKHGYARLTTAKIADESELSEAGLYYHYDSKDEMIAVFLEAAADYLAEDLAALEADDPEARLRAACDRLFTDAAEEVPRGVDVAVMELLSHAPYNETLREPLRGMVANTLDHLAAVIAEGVEKGTFRPVDPQGTAAFLLAAAHGATGFYLALGMETVGESLHAQVETFVESLLEPDRE